MSASVMGVLKLLSRPFTAPFRGLAAIVRQPRHTLLSASTAGLIVLSFPPYNVYPLLFVALNEAAATLHYQHLERRPPPRHRALLIDAGAGFAGYGSDITRTWSSADDEFAASGLEHAAFDNAQAVAHVESGLCQSAHADVDARRIFRAFENDDGDDFQ